jgi:hypothetical protein
LGAATQKSAYCLERINTIISTPVDWKRKSDQFKAKRDQLFAKYLKHPLDTRLALEIKALDDQVAECVEQIQLERRAKK